MELQKNCLKNQKQADVFEYFKETAAAVSLVAEGGLNILSAQYERIKSVSDATVLSCYLDSSKKPAVRALPEAVIYPFGLNQSQKTAKNFPNFLVGQRKQIRKGLPTPGDFSTFQGIGILRPVVIQLGSKNRKVLPKYYQRYFSGEKVPLFQLSAI